MTASASIGGERHLGMAAPAKTASGDRTQHRREARSMSFENFFNHRFAKFLQENFDNPTQAAAAFRVRERTAENWWQGTNAPSGPKVARAFMDYPESAVRHLTIGTENEGDRARSSGGRT